ncbi:MAG TPA: hypothetical protein PLM62_12920, partial [Zoogloea sp.]|nr:hypothetical protein [Zoogloea sp.]
RKEGTPEGGATAGYVFLPTSLSYNKEVGRPPGRDPANVTYHKGKPSVRVHRFKVERNEITTFA